MLGLLVLSHGRFAEELVNAARKIVGEIESFQALSMEWDADVEEATRRVDEAIQKVDQGQGVLVLTDMFGGTPTNLAMSLHEKDEIEIVTGVNLPMLIKFVNLREELDLHQAAGRIADQGRQAIQVASHVLDRPRDAAEEPGD